MPEQHSDEKDLETLSTVSYDLNVAHIAYSVHYPTSKDNKEQYWVVTVSESLNVDQVKVLSNLDFSLDLKKGTAMRMGKVF